jgi:hypothetical protein
MQVTQMAHNKALHSDAPALRDVVARTNTLSGAALGFPRSLRSLGAGERRRWASEKT